LLTGGENCLENTECVREHFIVPEPQDLPSERFQLRGSPIVSRRPVLPPIGFDDDFALDAGEIGNERPNCHLPSELESSELPIAEIVPESTFGIGGLATEALCVRIGSADCSHALQPRRGKTLTQPSPARGGGL
jgi:hypothetical protein